MTVDDDHIIGGRRCICRNSDPCSRCLSAICCRYCDGGCSCFDSSYLSVLVYRRNRCVAAAPGDLLVCRVSGRYCSCELYGLSFFYRRRRRAHAYACYCDRICRFYQRCLICITLGTNREEMCTCTSGFLTEISVCIGALKIAAVDPGLKRYTTVQHPYVLCGIQFQITL